MRLRFQNRRTAKPVTNFGAEAICDNNFGQGDTQKPAPPNGWYFLDQRAARGLVECVPIRLSMHARN